MERELDILDFFALRQGDEFVSPMQFYHQLWSLPEHKHLQEGNCQVHFFFSTQITMRQGMQILGTVFQPQVQGRLNNLFKWLLRMHCGYMPDFIIILDEAFWLTHDNLQREILVYHEMKHIKHATDQDGELKYDDAGNPVWTLAGHDVEEFNDTVKRYGAYSSHMRVFRDALGIGEASRDKSHD